MVATIASSLADLFGHPSVRGNIYLQDLKAWPDIMIIAVFLIHNSVATNGSFGLIQSHLCLVYKNLLTIEEGFSKTTARELGLRGKAAQHFLVTTELEYERI